MLASLPSVLENIQTYIKDYENVYRHLHRNPELSRQEHKTAAFIAEELQKLQTNGAGLDIEVLTGIGGTGLVAVIKNGKGKTVLLRAELDALPLLENTGLPYSSQCTGRGDEPVAMHACGHDLHMSSLLCAARVLTTCAQTWSGTLIVLFQPSEEDGSGAGAMVEAGLYDPSRYAVPIPDAILAGHTMPGPAGQVKTRQGVVNAAAESITVTIHGKGGHGARPHTAIDPIVVASSIVMKLQTIVSRETAPQESVVVTIGSLHAGSAENIISNCAVMKINMRALSSEGLAHAYEAVTRMIDCECRSFRCPQPPTIERIGGFPLLWNDPSLTGSIVSHFKEHFGQEYQDEDFPSLGSEDICNLIAGEAKCCFWNIGCIDRKMWNQLEAEGRLREVAGNHSAEFAPVIQPTLLAAVEALLIAALSVYGQHTPETN